MKIVVAPFVNTRTGRNVKTATATPTGIKISGRVLPTGIVLGMLPKGEARKVRKQLRGCGFRSHAAAIA